MTIEEKFNRLKEILRSFESVAVAFSGGVDSTFLLKVAHDVLKNNAVAITAASSFVPQREIEEAKNFCAAENIRQIIFKADVLSIDGVKENPQNRCYLCKYSLFKNFLNIAAENKISCVVEGSNKDDEGDYRPGMKALAELKIKSPLRSAGLFKYEIRQLSQKLNLPTADKPSMACLATRFVYGEILTAEKLARVETAENFLYDAGFKQLRVRVHNNLARIEILPADFEKIFNVREKIIAEFKNFGFDYITLDLQGYRSGSMNLNLKTPVNTQPAG